MENKVRVLPPEILMDQLLDLLEETEPVPLLISGNSMSPFMVHGRDTVYLSKIKKPLKKGDMILYRRTSGTYILHRICNMQRMECSIKKGSGLWPEKGSYDLIGDAQCEIEKGIQPEQVLAVVTAVRRKGKLLTKDSLCWQFFEKIWLRLIPLRPGLIKTYTAVKKWRKHI